MVEQISESERRNPTSRKVGAPTEMTTAPKSADANVAARSINNDIKTAQTSGRPAGEVQPVSADSHLPKVNITDKPNTSTAKDGRDVAEVQREHQAAAAAGTTADNRVEQKPEVQQQTNMQSARSFQPAQPVMARESNQNLTTNNVASIGAERSAVDTMQPKPADYRLAEVSPVQDKPLAAAVNAETYKNYQTPQALAQASAQESMLNVAPHAIAHVSTDISVSKLLPPDRQPEVAQAQPVKQSSEAVGPDRNAESRLAQVHKPQLVESGVIPYRNAEALHMPAQFTERKDALRDLQDKEVRLAGSISLHDERGDGRRSAVLVPVANERGLFVSEKTAEMSQHRDGKWTTTLFNCPDANRADTAEPHILNQKHMDNARSEKGENDSHSVKGRPEKGEIDSRIEKGHTQKGEIDSRTEKGPNEKSESKTRTGEIIRTEKDTRNGETRGDKGQTRGDKIQTRDDKNENFSSKDQTCGDRKQTGGDKNENPGSRDQIRSDKQQDGKSILIEQTKTTKMSDAVFNEVIDRISGKPFIQSRHLADPIVRRWLTDTIRELESGQYSPERFQNRTAVLRAAREMGPENLRELHTRLTRSTDSRTLYANLDSNKQRKFYNFIEIVLTNMFIAERREGQRRIREPRENTIKAPRHEVTTPTRELHPNPMVEARRNDLKNRLTDASGKDSYTVKVGQTLSWIAWNIFDDSKLSALLAQINGYANPITGEIREPRPGTKLILPTPEQIEKFNSNIKVEKTATLGESDENKETLDGYVNVIVKCHRCGLKHSAAVSCEDARRDIPGKKSVKATKHTEVNATKQQPIFILPPQSSPHRIEAR